MGTTTSYPKLREYLHDNPGWYYLYAAALVRHSTELLTEKTLRSQRAMPSGEHVPHSIAVGRGDEIIWFLGPDLADKTMDEQRVWYYEKVMEMPDHPSAPKGAPLRRLMRNAETVRGIIAASKP